MKYEVKLKKRTVTQILISREKRRPKSKVGEAGGVLPKKIYQNKVIAHVRVHKEKVNWCICDRRHVHKLPREPLCIFSIGLGYGLFRSNDVSQKEKLPRLLKEDPVCLFRSEFFSEFFSTSSLIFSTQHQHQPQHQHQHQNCHETIFACTSPV